MKSVLRQNDLSTGKTIQSKLTHAARQSRLNYKVHNLPRYKNLLNHLAFGKISVNLR
jgi:hypothetical protein